MIGNFSDIQIPFQGGATGRTNKLNSLLYFQEVRRLGELMTVRIMNDRRHHEAPLLPFLGVQGN